MVLFLGFWGLRRAPKAPASAPKNNSSPPPPQPFGLRGGGIKGGGAPQLPLARGQLRKFYPIKPKGDPSLEGSPFAKPPAGLEPATFGSGGQRSIQPELWGPVLFFNLARPGRSVNASQGGD